MGLNVNLVYVGIAAVAVYFIWIKKLGGTGVDTIIEGGIPFEEQAAPGPPDSNENPADNRRQDYLVAVGPLIGWLQDLREAHEHMVRDVSQNWFPARVRNHVVARLGTWRGWIDTLLSAHSAAYHIPVSDFAQIASSWTGHMYWFDNVRGHGVNYNDNEVRHAEMARDNARRYIEPVVNQYNNLDDNLFGFYERYREAGVVEPESHLGG